jgi:hypothetical protein
MLGWGKMVSKAVVADFFFIPAFRRRHGKNAQTKDINSSYHRVHHAN